MGVRQRSNSLQSSPSPHPLVKSFDDSEQHSGSAMPSSSSLSSSKRNKKKRHQRKLSAPLLLRANSTSSNHSMTLKTAPSISSAPTDISLGHRPSALRKGKFTTSTSNSSSSTILSTPAHRPRSNSLKVIHDLIECDKKNDTDSKSLYDVLCIGPSADAPTIRRAYLVQGRKCLAVQTGDAPRNLKDVPTSRRRKFQAVSIAYEILSTPELRSNYDKYGVVCALDNGSSSREQPQQHSHELSRSNPNNVRWKAYVEEKVITDAHPDEHSVHSGSYNNHTPYDNMDVSSVDSSSITSEDNIGWLDKFDKEADKFLKGTYIDKVLDESITGLQQTTSSLKASFDKELAMLPSKLSFQDESFGSIQQVEELLPQTRDDVVVETRNGDSVMSSISGSGCNSHCFSPLSVISQFIDDVSAACLPCFNDPLYDYAFRDDELTFEDANSQINHL